jgi:DNA polymerase III delta prime subunit
VLDRERWREVVQPTLDRMATALAQKAFPHSLLLVGPPGLGRETAAAEAAAMLVCPDQTGPWCECSSCARVRRGIHPDVGLLWPEGSSQQIKIEQIRAVVEAVTGRPFEGRRRVWVLDGVESGRLRAAAANAFLKTLEEPPDHVVFVLLASNPAAVLPTVLSRCHQLLLPPAVSVATHLGVAEVPPELASSSLRGAEVSEALEASRSALLAALDGEVMDLLRLARGPADEDIAFEVVASAALELAAEADDACRAEDLVRLARELVACDRRSRALNLNRERQLLSCLLSWHQGEV